LNLSLNLWETELKLFKLIAVLGVAIFFSNPALALLEIEITQGVEGALPVAVLDFSTNIQADPGTAPGDIIRSDLYRSGQFSPKEGAAPAAQTSDSYKSLIKQWRAQQVDYLLTGHIEQQGADRYRIEFRLFDTLKGEQLLGRSTLTTAKGVRMVSHRISNYVYEKLLGIPGAFDTRVAYVTVQGKEKGRRYVLQVADADGHNPRSVFSSDQPVMSPSWSPDNRYLAYVSFEGHRASVYIQELATGKRQKVSSEKGINGAPTWSPDGKQLALALSRDGNPEIYILDIATKKLTRVTRNRSIDTEPVWSRNGQSLIFTSDRSGSPQLYKKLIRGGRATRLSFDGSYNSAPDLDADGDRIAHVHRSSGRFQIAVLNLETGQVRALTNGKLDESPSFSPNGSMIIYATEDRGRGVLAAVSVDGRVRQILRLQEGEVREPVWSGYSEASGNRTSR
jgi:TolB protein